MMTTSTRVQAALTLTKRSSSSSAKVMSSLLGCYGSIISTTTTSSFPFSSLSYPRPQTITIKSEFDAISLTWRRRQQKQLGSSNHGGGGGGGGGFGSKLLMRKAAGFSTTSSSFNASSSGSIDSPMVEAMTNKIKEQLKADFVIVKDAYGDGRHVSIDVISAAFEGQSAVNRQRMVYQAIREELQSTVHAVDQMTTRTPAEAGKN